jgi:hypothetical protein
VGTWVWVVHTYTRTRLPVGYNIMPINVPTGKEFIPYQPLCRVKPVEYTGFGYPLPSIVHSVITETFHSKLSSVDHEKWGICTVDHVVCGVKIEIVDETGNGMA